MFLILKLRLLLLSISGMLTLRQLSLQQLLGPVVTRVLLWRLMSHLLLLSE